MNDKMLGSFFSIKANGLNNPRSRGFDEEKMSDEAIVLCRSILSYVNNANAPAPFSDAASHAFPTDPRMTLPYSCSRGIATESPMPS